MPFKPKTHRACPKPITPRPSSAKRLYGYTWQRASKAFLREHPVCECDECTAEGRLLIATVVDHYIPHRGNHALFWDRSNWRANSKTCHDRKTAKHDGAFGRPRREGGGNPGRSAA